MSALSVNLLLEKVLRLGGVFLETYEDGERKPLDLTRKVLHFVT